MTFRQALSTINHQFKAVEEKLSVEGISLQHSARHLTMISEALDRGCYGVQGVRTIDALTNELPAKATLPFETLADAAKIFARTASSVWPTHLTVLAKLLETATIQDFDTLHRIVDKAYKIALMQHRKDGAGYSGYNPAPARIGVDPDNQELYWVAMPPPDADGCYPQSEVDLTKNEGKWQITYKGTCRAVRARLEKARRPPSVTNW